MGRAPWSLLLRSLKVIFDWFQYGAESYACRAYFRALLCPKNRSFCYQIFFDRAVAQNNVIKIRALLLLNVIKTSAYPAKERTNACGVLPALLATSVNNPASAPAALASVAIKRQRIVIKSHRRMIRRPHG
jgi:hypothetical protein